ncbi:MAG: thiol:disulfide interchange protein DsbA/DsbL [bacterium]|nr:thiol:disulfide interchange protein DsbA/DsbL [Gammaproteobacteria bacterium]HIL97385.1 thiol:disulfide interchange protein DsbA/DsbL [Pseudomonadales bacterium]
MARRESRFLKQQKMAVGVALVIILGVMVYLSTLLVSDVPGGEFVEGEHYTLLENPRRIRGDKIEIMEFFSYGCIHCYNFDDDLADWVEAHEDTITFIRTPVLANELWRNYGRAYYAMEELGMLEENHARLFREVHDGRKILGSADKLASLLASGDVSQESIATAYSSTIVNQKIARADSLSRRFKIATVPNVVVNGKYLVKSTREVGLARMLDVMDYLIEKETQPEAD